MGREFDFLRQSIYKFASHKPFDNKRRSDDFNGNTPNLKVECCPTNEIMT